MKRQLQHQQVAPNWKWKSFSALHAEMNCSRRQAGKPPENPKPTNSWQWVKRSVPDRIWARSKFFNRLANKGNKYSIRFRLPPFSFRFDSFRFILFRLKYLLSAFACIVFVLCLVIFGFSTSNGGGELFLSDGNCPLLFSIFPAAIVFPPLVRHCDSENFISSHCISR